MPNLTLCAIPSGYPIQCRVPGGNNKLYIGNWNDTSTTFTLGAGASASLITTVGGTYSKYYPFEFEVENLSFSGGAKPVNENGTTYYEIVVEGTLTNYTYELANIMTTLEAGAFRMIVLTGQGRYFMVGYDRPVRTQDGSDFGSHQKYNDLNGYKFSFVCKSMVPAPEMTSTAALTLINAA